MDDNVVKQKKKNQQHNSLTYKEPYAARWNPMLTSDSIAPGSMEDVPAGPSGPFAPSGAGAGT